MKKIYRNKFTTSQFSGNIFTNIKAMKRRVNNLTIYRELRLLKRSMERILNQTSELYIGSNSGDGVTGAPVIEIGYTQM